MRPEALPLVPVLPPRRCTIRTAPYARPPTLDIMGRRTAATERRIQATDCCIMLDIFVTVFVTVYVTDT